MRTNGFVTELVPVVRSACRDGVFLSWRRRSGPRLRIRQKSSKSPEAGPEWRHQAMPGERRIRILAALVGAGGAELETVALCEVSAMVTDMSGAAIVLLTDDAPQGSICTSNELSAVLERLQFELGEGPCVDAHAEKRPVSEPDLGGATSGRWPAFARPAIEAGVGAVFAFPLQVGAARLGALQLHDERPGALSDEQHADALVMADIAAQAVLVMQSDAPPGLLGKELEAGADFKYVVHQASGMVAAQLDVSVTTALIRLRAHAFGNDRSLTDVAASVVARTLRFDDNSGEKDPRPDPGAYS